MVSLLEGCRVLDLADEKGAYCGRMLADFGADVIAIEPPTGSPARGIGPFHKDDPDPEKSLYWFHVAANKRGITLNLESVEGRRLFLRLVDSADVVVESGPPGYLDQLGLGYQELGNRKPSLVVTSVTPFGQVGPYRDFVAADLTLAAMGGLVRLYGYLDTPPIRISAPQAYFHGSSHAAMASTLAYYHAELTGEGQFVDVSIQEALVLTMMNTTERWELMGVNTRGTGPFLPLPRPAPQPSLLMRLAFPVLDGVVMLLLMGGAQAGAVASSRKIVELANADGYALEYADYSWERQDTALATQEEINRLTDAIGAWLATKTKAELFAKAVEHGLLLAPASTAKDLAGCPQLAARGFWVSVAHPELGEVLAYPGAPVKAAAAPWAIRRRAPLLGEHNEEIYMGELGLSRARLVQLKETGVT